MFFQDAESSFTFADNSLRKQIVRAKQFDLSNSVVIYLHGWSASPMETYPIPHQIAEKLNIPVVLQRLSGHGLGTDGFKDINAQKLWNDTLEAVQVARKLGRNIFIMGCSTGATLAMDFALKFTDQIAGLIIVSPNFK